MRWQKRGPMHRVIVRALKLIIFLRKTEDFYSSGHNAQRMKGSFIQNTLIASTSDIILH